MTWFDCTMLFLVLIAFAILLEFETLSIHLLIVGAVGSSVFSFIKGE